MKLNQNGAHSEKKCTDQKEVLGRRCKLPTRAQRVLSRSEIAGWDLVYQGQVIRPEKDDGKAECASGVFSDLGQVSQVPRTDWPNPGLEPT